MSKINIIVDKLTNSIENRITGDVFDTQVLAIVSQDLKTITKKNNWLFSWKKETQTANVFKLVVQGNTVIQGLISLIDNGDSINIPLIESAPFNRGDDKVYLGVAGNLFAYACKTAFDKGYDGCVSFYAKTALFAHYQTTLGAKRIGHGLLMVIDPPEAKKLVDRYSKP